MKYLKCCTILLVFGLSIVEIESMPVENPEHQVAVLLPKYIQADLPAATANPEKSMDTHPPLTLLDVEDSNKSSGDVTQDYQRRTRFLGFGSLGGLGGLGNKFSGLGLGGLGGLGSWGLGGLHGFGLGGFKPFFGHFG